MKRFIILFIACISLITNGCENSASKFESSSIIAIFTSAVKEKSQLVYIDSTGKKIASRNIKKQGIFELVKTQDTLILPVRFGREILITNIKDGKTEEFKTLEFPLFYYNKQGSEFVIYNSDTEGDIEYLTYEVKTAVNKVTKRIKGFPQCMAAENGKAYVFTDIVDEGRKQINIINLDNLNIERSIPYSCELAGDIKVIDNYIYLTDVSKKQLVRISLKNTGEMVKKDLSSGNPVFILDYKDKLFIVHSEAVTAIDKGSLEVKNELKLGSKALKAKIFKDTIYILSQQNSGIILEIDVENLNLRKTIQLDGGKDMLVQDFEIM